MKPLQALLLPPLAYAILRALSWTWRYRASGDPATLALLAQRHNFVFAHLHQQEWCLMPYWGPWRMNVMVSLSRDGDAMARVVRWFGYRVTRGSTSRGATGALLRMVKLIREQRGELPTSLAVDGPRGPFGEPKKGLLLLAREQRSPIILAAVKADRFWEFSASWARTRIARPFARIDVRYTMIPLTDIEAVVTDDDWQAMRARISADLCYYLDRED